MSAPRDRPRPRIQPAHGWSGVERRNACRRGVGRESLTWGVSGDRGDRGRRPRKHRAGAPDCRCNGTYRCRASNPRRVGLGRGAGTLLVVGAGARKPLPECRGGASAAQGCNPVSAPFPDRKGWLALWLTVTPRTRHPNHTRRYVQMKRNLVGEIRNSSYACKMIRQG